MTEYYCKTMLLLVQSHQSLAFLSCPLVCGHIYMPHVETFLTAHGHTHKDINITTCSNTCYMICWSIRQSWI